MCLPTLLFSTLKEAGMLTDTWIKSAKPKDKVYRKSDGDGLEIEISPKGRKTWRYRYRMAGKQEKVTLGKYPALSLKDARKKRDELTKLVEQGISPARCRQQNKRVAPEQTIREFGERYYTEVVCRDRKRPEEMKRYLDREVYPQLGHRLLSAVTVEDVRRIVEKKKAHGADSSAAQIRNLIKRLYDHAIAAGLAESNPAAALPGRFITTARSRDRVLSKDEIKLFLTTIYQSNIRRQFKLALHLLLLTLARKGELLNARWEHVDFEAGEWHVPKESSKTGKPHIVYLSSQAIELFRELQSLAAPSELVLPGRGSLTRPFADNALNKTLDGLTFDMMPFTIHDLRRTAATHLAEMNYSSDYVEKALNHLIRGVRGIYNRAEYADQRRDMLQHWANIVDDLVTENKVIIGHFNRTA
jgi:integrase